jgi:hypothetical protein
MSILAIVATLILIGVLIAGLPHWPYIKPANLGYFPSGVALALLIVLLILFLAGLL